MKSSKVKLKVESLSLCPKKGVASLSCQSIEAALEGLVGDRHFGFVKKADARDSGVPKGAPVRNWRQWSAVSSEELNKIAGNLKVDHVKFESLGANLTLSGVAEFTALPRGTSLWFPSGAILSVEDENVPCIHPGREIAKYTQIRAQDFVKASIGMRGLVGVVFRAGALNVGDEVIAHVPRPL